MQPVCVSTSIRHYANGSLEEVEDSIVTEFPMTILLNQEEFATLLCSPEHMEELAIGFLASEGVIGSCADLSDIFVDESTGYAYVTAKQVNRYNQLFHSKRYVTSCCGKSRQSFYFYNDARTVKNLEENGLTITIADCFRLMELMQQSASLFQSTGGVHNAALCDKQGVVIYRTDIGRHNALDKLYGHCLKHSIKTDDKIMVFSGRISSEVLLKVAKIGCSIVLSKSAPTELALRLADELGMTTVGFIRNQLLNIYTWPNRIEMDVK
ncbi:formate dehydrogenase accessory sulfurtransferase FdhD [Brevibacillus ginsengisoli]|uniref:formate dehydrogenase accessory sulfurtransferase FdhD n=1 Tax=Brevibacillus ginsengisoli TaxID=363854 RepID=UPI003CF89FB4